MRSSILLSLLVLAGMTFAAASFGPAGPDIDSLIRSEMAVNHVPGLAACAVRGGEIVWHGEYGFARLEDSIHVVDTTDKPAL